MGPESRIFCKCCEGGRGEGGFCPGVLVVGASVRGDFCQEALVRGAYVLHPALIDDSVDGLQANDGLSRLLGRESGIFYKCCENKVDGSWQFKQWKWAADDER